VLAVTYGDGIGRYMNYIEGAVFEPTTGKIRVERAIGVVAGYQWKPRADLRFNFVDREATFVNAGFPVNFDGRVNCVPAHYIQPTPTMMCAAAVQAGVKRVFILDGRLPHAIIMEMLTDEGVVLLDSLGEAWQELSTSINHLNE